MGFAKSTNVNTFQTTGWRFNIVDHRRRLLKRLTFTLLIVLTHLGATAHAAPPLADGKYLLQSEADGHRKCLIFSGNGGDTYPSRHNWGGGEYCGFPGGKTSLLQNRQAVFLLTNIDGGELYTIESDADGARKCLLFGGNGNEQYPSRHNWGSGAQFCGLPGGKTQLVNNRQAVWRIKSVGENKFTLQSAADGTDKCLIFGGNGAEQYPSRHNWAQGDHCGMPGGLSTLIANKQAIWIPTPVTEPPVADGHYLIQARWNNRTECLLFGDNGKERYPSRHNWAQGADEYCGYPGSEADIANNPQVVFALKNLDGGDLYMITARWNNRTECLIFSNNGNERSPSRHHWGDPSQDEYCGLTGGKAALMQIPQAVWRIRPTANGQYLIQSRGDGLWVQCLGRCV